ncbi:MAG: hypothetical protein KGS09_16240 [Nitrospirae bacterium]|nr:hypothetical protein [Nitrospirota bacterium]MDE3040130.1 hypothetical protein [Nitrospirota bacterium]
MGEQNEPYASSQLMKHEQLRTITASTSGQSYLGHARAQPEAERRQAHGVSSMSPPWPQPGDRFAPMSANESRRHSCLRPDDCLVDAQ